MGESFGLWLKQDFEFNAEKVGYYTFVFGAGELTGNVLMGKMSQCMNYTCEE